MAELKIQLTHIRENLQTLDQYFFSRGLQWTLVLKVLAGHTEYFTPILKGLNLKALIGVADSRLDHLISIKKNIPGVMTWQIRPPVLQNVSKVIEFVDVSCNSSYLTLSALNKAAKRKKTIHKVVIMVELGENREGVLVEDLPALIGKTHKLANLEIVGIGTNLGCLHGVQPTFEKIGQLLHFKDVFEIQYGLVLPLISGGSSINLPLIHDGSLPHSINHYRIGEAAFFGTTPLDGSVFQGLHSDNFVFSSAVLEVNSKEFEPSGPLIPSAIGEAFTPPPATQKGVQAILDFGILDVDCKNLSCQNPNYQILGSTSDMTTIYVPDGKVCVGDNISFTPNYMAVAKLMISNTVCKSFY